MSTPSSSDSGEEYQPQTSRRRFAQSVLGVGGVLSFGGIFGSATRRKRVPKYLQKDTVIETMKVPKKWDAHHKTAQSAVRSLNENHFDHPAIMETGLVRSEQTYGGKNGFSIEVFVDEAQQSPDLPDAVSGVPVRTVQRDRDYRGLTECDNRKDYDEYTGGVIISDNFGSGTSGYRVEYNGSEYMLTAMHIFGDCSITEGDTTFMDQEDLGNIEDGDVQGDWAITDASNNSNTYISNDVREPDGTQRPITGYASESEIGDRVSNVFDGYTKLGITTGETTGGLGKKDITVGSCPDLHGEGVRGSADQAEGDSGGPAYSIENGDAYMLFHAVYGVSEKGSITCDGNDLVEYNKSLGIGAYYVNNQGYKIGN